MKRTLFGFTVDEQEPDVVRIIDETLAEVPPLMAERQKVALVKDVVSRHVKNAMMTEVEYRQHPKETREYISEGYRTTNFTDLLGLGWGVCTHFHTLALVLFEALGIRCEFWGNHAYHHSFLRIVVDDTEEVYDHFSESWQGKLFPDDCYDRNNSVKG